MTATTLTIISTAIKQDAEGRFCLNDCHRASGGDPSKKPSEWARNVQTNELVAEISQSGNSHFAPLETNRGGNSPGTYACRELVYAYAMWISPSFHLKVIRAFDVLVRGNVPAPAGRAVPRPRRPSLATTFQTGMKLAKTAGLEGGHAQKAAARYCERLGLENPLELMGMAPDRDSMGVSFADVILWFFQGMGNDDIQYFAQNEVPTAYRSLARDECKRRGFPVGRGRR
ncbi:KilA-N domain-containing protein [Parasaccharibacter sp. TMW 2.1888]|uniref:KilA-N domain-containing protein n=1 Tax=Parasaccharibacter sp. TMW 2.1888 TaxID=2268025 RepID=UPI00205931E2|nr:KilA-N domain-containing protein [Parasaccharibacter sp. TMW 2.1888]UPO80328.1 KilA-N domain-containing protein [Parasaccharibacter sp. TMW 2.1888]